MNSFLLAKRWRACVDFGSPMSAWSKLMLDCFEESGHNHVKAAELLREKQKLPNTKTDR